MSSETITQDTTENIKETNELGAQSQTVDSIFNEIIEEETEINGETATGPESSKSATDDEFSFVISDKDDNHQDLQIIQDGGDEETLQSNVISSQIAREDGIPCDCGEQVGAQQSEINKKSIKVEEIHVENTNKNSSDDSVIEILDNEISPSKNGNSNPKKPKGNFRRCIVGCPEFKMLHRVPTRIEEANLWFNLLGRPDLLNAANISNFRVCNRHFSEKMRGNSGLRLYVWALPDINLPPNSVSPVITKQQQHQQQQQQVMQLRRDNFTEFITPSTIIRTPFQTFRKISTPSNSIQQIVQIPIQMTQILNQQQQQQQQQLVKIQETSAPCTPVSVVASPMIGAPSATINPVIYPQQIVQTNPERTQTVVQLKNVKTANLPVQPGRIQNSKTISGRKVQFSVVNPGVLQTNVHFAGAQMNAISPTIRLNNLQQQQQQQKLQQQQQQFQSPSKTVKYTTTPQINNLQGNPVTTLQQLQQSNTVRYTRTKTSQSQVQIRNLPVNQVKNVQNIPATTVTPRINNLITQFTPSTKNLNILQAIQPTLQSTIPQTIRFTGPPQPTQLNQLSMTPIMNSLPLGSTIPISINQFALENPITAEPYTILDSFQKELVKQMIENESPEIISSPDDNVIEIPQHLVVKIVFTKRGEPLPEEYKAPTTTRRASKNNHNHLQLNGDLRCYDIDQIETDSILKQIFAESSPPPVNRKPQIGHKSIQCKLDRLLRAPNSPPPLPSLAPPIPPIPFPKVDKCISTEDTDDEFESQLFFQLPEVKNFRYIGDGKCECLICGKLFQTSAHAKIHMQMHQEKSTLCSRCGRIFISNKKCVSHERTCGLIGTAEKMEKEISINVGKTKRKFRCTYSSTASERICQYCGKYSNSLLKHLDHLNSHTGDKPHKCSCGAQFRNIPNFYTHRKRFGCKNAPAEIPYGMRLRPRKKGLNNGEAIVVNKIKEIKRRGKNANPDRYVCKVCGHRSKDYSAFRSHRKKHITERKFICQACNNSYKDIITLRSHIRSVHLQRTECKYCGKRCTSNYLMVHLRLHTGERPYECPLCNEKFISNVLLKSHKRSVHNIGEPVSTYQESKSYICTICSIYFRTKKTLENHTAKETHLVKEKLWKESIGIEEFVCMYCSSNFEDYGKFAGHLGSFHNQHVFRRMEQHLREIERENNPSKSFDNTQQQENDDDHVNVDEGASNDVNVDEEESNKDDNMVKNEGNDNNENHVITPPHDDENDDDDDEPEMIEEYIEEIDLDKFDDDYITNEFKDNEAALEEKKQITNLPNEDEIKEETEDLDGECSMEQIIQVDNDFQDDDNIYIDVDNDEMYIVHNEDEIIEGEEEIVSLEEDMIEFLNFQEVKDLQIEFVNQDDNMDCDVVHT